MGVAGAPGGALRLLAIAQAGPLDELEQARAQLLHAQIIFAMTRGSDAAPRLLQAAKRLEPLNATLARETYLEAFAAALATDRLVRGWDARQVAGAVLAADWEPSTRACDLLLDGLARLVRDGYDAAAPALTRRGACVPGRAALRGGRAAVAVGGLPNRPGAGRLSGVGRAHRAPSRARAPRRRVLPLTGRARRPRGRRTRLREHRAGHVTSRRVGRRYRGHRQPPVSARLDHAGELARAGRRSAANVTRQELAPDGIHVAALHVAYMDTDMTAGIAAPKADPAEVAALARDGIENDLAEILADETTRSVKQGLSRPSDRPAAVAV